MALRGNQRQSVAIRGDQRAITGQSYLQVGIEERPQPGSLHLHSHARAVRCRRQVHLPDDRRSSEVIRGHQRPSKAIRSHQRPSEVIRGHQRSSEVIRGHQRPSEAIKGNQPSKAISGYQRHSRGTQEVLRGHQRTSEVITWPRLAAAIGFISKLANLSAPTSSTTVWYAS